LCEVPLKPIPDFSSLLEEDSTQEPAPLQHVLQLKSCRLTVWNSPCLPANRERAAVSHVHCAMKWENNFPFNRNAFDLNEWIAIGVLDG
jgi:hypothetical protein